MKTMSYRYYKDKKIQERWYIAGALFLVIGLFTPIYSWFFDIIERPLARSWENQGEIFKGTENFFESLYGKQQILEENEKLQNRVSRLEIDNLRTQYLSEELEKIYQLKESNSNLIPAHVLKSGTIGSYDSLVINQGSRNEINVGDSIVAFDNVLIGFVDKIYNTTSHVTLYSQAQQSISGVLFPHDINLVAQGYGKGSFFIETPREIEVVEGDIFYSLEQPGYIIAIIREVVFDPRDPFKQVYLSYPVNLNEVQVIGIKKQTLTSTIVE